MNNDDLLDLIKDDDSGLLDIQKKPVSVTPDDRLSESFAEVNEFFDQHQREPKFGDDIYEHKLASRLKHIRANKDQREFLLKHDKHSLLVKEVKDLDTVADIFADDDMDMLSVEDDSIFNIKNVPEIERDRSDPDFVARRERCIDFDKFELLFIQCQADIKNGRKKLATFVESEMKEGDFFVLSGVLIYLDNISNPYRGNSEKINRRTRCIYENGTESNILLRSLGKRLAEVGFAVSYTTNTQITEDDQEAGYIYVLKSLSTDSRISSTKNLFKIGFSTIDVGQRIQNAEQDPTYLMAPVSVVSTFKCFNMNPQRLERLLHRFFSGSRLDLEVTDKNGNKYTPKEWFIAPINVIEKTIELILSGQIINYSYDSVTGIIDKNNKHE